MTDRDIDPLFIGLTKPPMTMGVPLMFFGINLIISTCGFILFVSLFSKILVIILLSLPLHALGYIATRKDPFWMEIFYKKASKCSPIRNQSYWKTNSYSP